MSNEDPLVKKILDVPMKKRMEMLSKQKAKIERSITEGNKHFIKENEKQFLVKLFGWEEIIYNNGYFFKKCFVKKGKTSDLVCNEKDVLIYVESGKLHLEYFIEYSDFEIVLNGGDAFHCSSGFKRQITALSDVVFYVISLQQEENDEKVHG